MPPHPPPSCRRCQGPMEPGFLAEQSRLRWVRGPLELGALGARMMGRRRLEILAFRCGSCGTLELLALDPREVALIQALAQGAQPPPPPGGGLPPPPPVDTVGGPPVSPSPWPDDRPG